MDAGWQVLAAVENDPDAATTYELNHPTVELIKSDIRDIDPSRLRKDLGLQKRRLTLLKACPPCQGYSTLGSTDPDDDRNDLVHEVWRFMREFQPRALLLENVPGLERDERLRVLLRRVRAIGYGVRTYSVDAQEFGVPQRRRRLIVLAVRGKKADELPERIQDKLPETFDAERAAAGKALALAGAIDGETDPLHQDRQYSEIVLRRIKAVTAGGGRFDFPDELKLSCHAKLKARHATSSYGRMRADQPAPTMTTRCTTPACGRFIHPSQNRAITLREAALLQTFPLHYAFHGGRISVERQIGNAVPVKMAEGLGRAVDAIIK